MQLKYCFKKESAFLTRTGRLIGIIAALLFFAITNPLLFKFTGTVLEQVQDIPQTSFAAVTQTPSGGGMGIDYSEITSLYSDSGMMFGVTMASVCSSSLLIIMILLMPAAGGEQKKRTMIVPQCSGLKISNYLTAKFVIYPLTVFALTFLSGMLSGLLCNALFPNNTIDGGIMLLAALLAGIYMIFVTCVYISLGTCTSHPGIMSAAVYVGTVLLQSLLEGMGLSQFNPFTLLTLVSGGMFTEDFDLSENVANIAVSVGISLLISVLMYFLALGVLNAKKINNQEEIKPEF